MAVELIFLVTTAPTKGTTTTDVVHWKREGQFVYAYYEYVQTAAGTAGSGDYLFRLPLGVTIDTSIVTVNTTNSSITGQSTVLSGGFAGYAAGANLVAPGRAVPYSSTQFRMAGLIGGAANIVKGGSTLSLNNTSVAFGGWIKAPVSGWEP